MASRAGYPIIGGPLDGRRANYADMRQRVVARRTTAFAVSGQVLTEGGKFHEHADEYHAYNRGGRSRLVPSMVWLHRSLFYGAA